MLTREGTSLAMVIKWTLRESEALEDLRLRDLVRGLMTPLALLRRGVHQIDQDL
jgi:hypothetical protein